MFVPLLRSNTGTVVFDDLVGFAERIAAANLEVLFDFDAAGDLGREAAGARHAAVGETVMPATRPMGDRAVEFDGNGGLELTAHPVFAGKQTSLTYALWFNTASPSSTLLENGTRIGIDLSGSMVDVSVATDGGAVHHLQFPTATGLNDGNGIIWP